MKIKGVAKAGILNEIVSLGVRLDWGKWRKQKTRIKVTGHTGLEANDGWLNRTPEKKMCMLEHRCEMICECKLLFWGGYLGRRWVRGGTSGENKVETVRKC